MTAPAATAATTVGRRLRIGVAGLGRAFSLMLPTFEQDARVQLVAACDPRPRYARVDLVRADDGEPALMELELIEPELFFRFHPPAADALAAEIADELGQPAPSAAGAPSAPLALRPRQPRRTAAPNASRASSNRV